jgi:tRNA(Ile2) C34 agmatinyltransferase TiaS
MSTALAQRTDVIAAPDDLVRPADGRLTLDELIVDVWEGLFVRGTAPCPVCPGSLTWSDGRGRCSDCGSALH